MATPELPGGDESAIQKFTDAAKLLGNIVRGKTVEVPVIQPVEPQRLVFPQATIITGI